MEQVRYHTLLRSAQFHVDWLDGTSIVQSIEHHHHKLNPTNLFCISKFKNSRTAAKLMGKISFGITASRAPLVNASSSFCFKSRQYLPNTVGNAGNSASSFETNPAGLCSPAINSRMTSCHSVSFVVTKVSAGPSSAADSLSGSTLSCPPSDPLVLSPSCSSRLCRSLSFPPFGGRRLSGWS